MQQVIMTVGLQASGKSTWAREWVKEKPGERKRVNRDELRLMLDAGDWSPENERFILSVRDTLVLKALREKKSIVIDDTNLRADNFTKVCELISNAGLSVVVLEKPFAVDLDEAIARDAKRTPNVGEKVIRDTWKKYIGKYGRLREPRATTVTAPVQGEAIERVEGVPDAIICDLDGTLALMGDRSPYDASRCDEVDRPNPPVIECVKAMHAKGVQIIFMSGREDKDRAPTERFIEKWVREHDLKLWGANGRVVPHVLFMRATADQRKDAIVKRELFDAHVRGKFNVIFCLDDRNQVVRNWREMGLTVFQVSEGNF